MNTPQDHLAPIWPLGIYFAAVILVVTGMIAGSYFLGPRRRHSGLGPYEGGLFSSGTAHIRMGASFYLVAMLFVVFDLEAVFVYGWAVAVRELGWTGYIEMVVFVGVLFAVLAYLWRQGALDSGGRPGRRPAAKA